MSLRSIGAVLVLFIVALLFQQGFFTPDVEPPQAQTLFIDTSRSAGITHNRQGIKKSIGQAWGDYDNDGWVDLYVTDSEGPNTLYRNNQNGTFSVSPLSGLLALSGAKSRGAIFVDYDNDGWKDLYVTNRGPNILFRNLGGTHFEDLSDFAGVADSLDGKTSSWGDYDQDGYLDLYVANWSCYPDCGRPTYGDADHLYRNLGNGTFEDVSALLGAQTVGAGFVASFTDFDNDGDLDIYLVNDQFINPLGNILWRNDGPGCDGWCFTEISEQAGVDRRVMGMGLSTADYDNDGDMDWYFSNAGPMTLYQNQGDGSFENVAAQAGVEIPTRVGWGSIFLDYDHDGWSDLYLAIAMATNTKDIPANALFHNQGDGTFERVTCNTGAADTGGTIGVASADYDRDGWVDFVIGNHVEGYRLYRNQGAAGADNHWFSLELVGGGPVNRDAVGTRVIVTTNDGNQQMDEVIAGASVGSGNELTLHFGLGSNSRIAELKIRWPDGLEQSFFNIRADRKVMLPYPVDSTAEGSQFTQLYAIQEHQALLALGVFFALTVLLVTAMINQVKQGERRKSDV
ncbi:MAG: CRTAC1 family protein [Chloroflexota bacterium]